MAAAATALHLNDEGRRRAAAFLYDNGEAMPPPQAPPKRRLLEKQVTKKTTTPTPKRSRENDDPSGRKLPRSEDGYTPAQSRLKSENVGSESVRFGKPLHPVNHEASFDRVAKWSAASHRSYSRLLSELARTKDQTYSDPRHQVKGLNGDARFNRIKECLDGFENKPIELQMMMHYAAFSVEGPLIWEEEYFSNTKMILDREGWKARISMLFILTQRKMGKTYFLGQHSVVHAMNPGIAMNHIACISKTLDQVEHPVFDSNITLIFKAILTVAIARRLFTTHAKRNEYSLTVNQAKRIEITKDNMSSEIRAYSGNPDVRISSSFVISYFWFVGWQATNTKERKRGAYN